MVKSLRQVLILLHLTVNMLDFQDPPSPPPPSVVPVLRKNQETLVYHVIKEGNMIYRHVEGTLVHFINVLSQ